MYLTRVLQFEQNYFFFPSAKEKLLSPLQVVEIVSRSKTLKVDDISDYLIRVLEEESKVIDSEKRLIEKHKNETKLMREHLHKVKHGWVINLFSISQWLPLTDISVFRQPCFVPRCQLQRVQRSVRFANRIFYVQAFVPWVVSWIEYHLIFSQCQILQLYFYLFSVVTKVSAKKTSAQRVYLKTKKLQVFSILRRKTLTIYTSHSTVAWKKHRTVFRWLLITSDAIFSVSYAILIFGKSFKNWKCLKE